mgnify:CR=1 FL=1
MRIKGLTRIFSGLRASYMPGQASVCPTRRLSQLQHPVVNVFRRGGLRCGRLATLNRDIAATQWGDLRHEGRETPAARRKEAPNGAKPPTLPLVSCSLTGAGLSDQAQLNIGEASPTGIGGARMAGSATMLVADEMWVSGYPLCRCCITLTLTLQFL